MGKFNYAELCFAFDHLYGLKEVHGIDSFDNLCRQTGYDEILMGTDVEKSDEALFTIILKHLDDLHSEFNSSSPFSKKNLNKELYEKIGIGHSFRAMLSQYKIYSDARKKFYPDDVPAYEEIGNTAYITFDSFKGVPEGVDHYKTPPNETATDTIGIITYAYSQIMR